MSSLKVLAKIFRDFGTETSISGINNAAKAKSKVRTAIWFLIFSVLGYYTAIGICDIVVEYYEYPVITNTDLTYKPEVDFPAVTICNLNRVNCHNAFLAMYTIKKQLAADNSGDKAKEKLEKSLTLYEKLLSADVTNCLYPICLNLKIQIGGIRRADKDNQLMIFLENGCKISQEENIKYCNFLLEIKDDSDAETGIKSKAEEKFTSLGCKMEDACKYCYIEPPSGPPPPGPPPSGPPPCENTAPSSCQVLIEETNQQENQENQEVNETNQQENETNQQPNQRRKRQFEPVSESLEKVNFDTDASFIKMMMEIPAEYRIELGHSLGSIFSLVEGINRTGFLKDCSYKGSDCTDPSYWNAFTTPKYGNCFTFNSGMAADKEVKTVTVTGSANGLVLEMFLDQTNYMYNKLSRKAGARITVHDPYFLPMPDEYGMNLAPNSASSMAVQLNEMKRMAAPYTSNCVKDWDNTNFTVPKEINYSLSLCQRLCHQSAVASNCSCYWPELYIPSFSDTSELFTFDQRPCDIKRTDNEDRICYEETIRQFDIRNRICPCEVACHERHFQSSVSVATWPSNQYWKLLALDVGTYTPEDINSGGPKGNEIKKTIQQDFTRVEVYYQTLNIQSIVQTEKYDLQSLFGSLGGALSLYLGCAVVMLFELVELIIDIGMRLWRNQKKNKVDEKNENLENAIEQSFERFEKFENALEKNEKVILESDLAEEVRLILWANGYIKQNFNLKN